VPALLATPDRRASDLVAILAPDVAVVWTRTASPEALAPYLADPVLAEWVRR
jgi:hypothetical protein